MFAVNVGARLDRLLPASRFHYRILVLIGGGMFLDAFNIYLQGAVLAALIGTGWPTPAQNANFQDRFVSAFARRFANLAL